MRPIRRINGINLNLKRNSRPVYIDRGDAVGFLDYYPTGAHPGAEKVEYVEKDRHGKNWKDHFWTGGEAYKGAYNTSSYRRKTPWG